MSSFTETSIWSGCWSPYYKPAFYMTQAGLVTDIAERSTIANGIHSFHIETQIKSYLLLKYRYILCWARLNFNSSTFCNHTALFLNKFSSLGHMVHDCTGTQSAQTLWSLNEHKVLNKYWTLALNVRYLFKQLFDDALLCTYLNYYSFDELFIT